MTTIAGSGKTEVVYGASNVINAEIQFFSNARLRVDTCMDDTRPSLALRIEPIRKSFLRAKDRDIKLRYITEITTENVPHCKELIKIAEVRHLDGIKGNFMVSEKEYLAPAISNHNSGIASQLVYSNLQEIVEQQTYIFDTLWNKGIPGIKRIREIEEGIERVETIALKSSTEIAKRIKKNLESSTEMKISSQPGGLELIYNNFLESYKQVLDKYRKGEHKGIRFITTINKHNQGLAILLLNEGVQIRHTKNLTPLSFSISNKEFLATAERMEGGKMIRSLLVSTEPVYIDHYNFIFEQLWDSSIDAIDRINDIKEGVDLADIEVIPRSTRSRQLYLELIKNAKEEILFIFPTSIAFIRQEKIGAISLAIEAAKKQPIKVRILVPYNQEVEDILKHEVVGEVARRPIYKADIDVKYTEQTSGTMATILVVDRKASLVMELRDNSKTTFDEAIGLSTYSNSKAGVLSYVAIFERLWKQTELYEKLKESEKVKEDFVHIAAHELRTPIQPILGLTQIVRSRIKDSHEQQLLDTVLRNAKRLQRLTQDILDISRIESKSLDLKKESFNLNDMILNAIEESKNQVTKEHKDTKLKLEFINSEDIFIEADKDRINQVISNLLSNAIKFRKEGTITVAAVPNNKETVVSITDTGPGIDSEILPRLFTKFATKSTAGTGLGLFISKSIIETHGGRIWGKNNYPEGKGATFGFSLPFQNRNFGV
jgi:two-component system, OmpR family, sensor histidine kinase VicK